MGFGISNLLNRVLAGQRLRDHHAHGDRPSSWTMDDRNLYHVLITRPKNQAVLSQQDGQLPVTKFFGCLTTHLTELCLLVQKEIGCDFRLIRLRRECEMLFRSNGNYDSYSCTLLIFEIVDSHDPAAPNGYVWIPKTDAHNIRVEPPRQCVIEYLETYKTKGLDINSNRLFPYSHAGWYRGACVWIKGELGKHGIQVKGVSQLRSGDDSCVLHVTSTCGMRFYMKAVRPGGWFEEVKVTLALGENMPEHFPKPLSYNLDKAWLLMQDYGETLGFEAFSAEQNPELMQHVLSRWAEIQRRSIPMTRELVRLGVPMFDGRRIEQELLKMLEDPEWFEAQREGMKDGERQRYSDAREYKDEYIAYLHWLLKKASEYKVPLALVHKDLNSVNVIEKGKGDYVFIDLFSSQISFPFLDVLNFARDLDGGDIGNLDFYLNFWTDYESIERLRELLFIVDDISLVMNKISHYLRYSMSEESESRRTRQDLRFTLIRELKKYRDVVSEHE